MNEINFSNNLSLFQFPLENINPFSFYELNNNNLLPKKQNHTQNNLSSTNYNENPFLLKEKNNIINIEESNKPKEEKYLLYFREHNFTNDKEIIKIDQKISEERKFYEKLSNNLEDEMKCCICLNKYKEPLLSPCCHHLFCKNCLYKWYSGNKNNCVFCRKNIDLESYIEISAFKEILPFLDLLKDKSKNYFTEIENNNINNSIILCSNKIHELNEKIEDKENDFTDKDNYIDKLNEIKAEYYCLNCNKPFCSDCICLTDDYSHCEHKNDHCIASIEILNEMKLFDLLYEKENNKSLEKLEKINETLKKSIDNLTKNKKNILLFIEYVKEIYIKFIEDNINTLNNILKENEIEINKIKDKFKDIDSFISNIKKEKNINNIQNMQEIQNYLNILSNFDKSPDSIKNEIKNILQFTGKIQIKEHMNKSIKIDKKYFDSVESYKLDLKNDISLIVVNENSKKIDFNNPFLVDFNSSDKNNNKNEIKSNKIKLIIQFDKFNLYLENKFFLPILFNNKNEFIVFEEIKESEDNFIVKENEKSNQQINNIFYGTMPLIHKNQRYFRTIVDIDKLMDNSDIIEINNNIDNEKNDLIKLFIYSLIIS